MANALLTDLYQLTMGQCYFNENKHNQMAYFDAFFRRIPDSGGYAVAGGLSKIVDYIQHFRFEESDIAYLKSLSKFSNDYLNYLKQLTFSCDISAVPDGTVVFAGEPILTVRGPLLQAQLIETALLLYLNHSTLIATKASRICQAAKGKAVMEFGARQAHGEYAATEGALYAYIGGCVGTSCVQTGKKYGIPVLGTMSHSFVQSHENEYEAFKQFAEIFPDNCIFVVDTVDTLKSGLPNAIRVHHEILQPQGKSLKGVRLDSGDLAVLSKQARKMLDDAGLPQVQLVVSNALDEFSIERLLSQGAPIDVLGVGENLITAQSSPVLGGVYKMCAVEENGTIVPKIKISDQPAKITTPGFKKVYRTVDPATGLFAGDKIAFHDEAAETGWKELHVSVFSQGKLVYALPSVKETKDYCTAQKAALSEDTKKLKDPKPYPVTLSPKLSELKQKMLGKA